MIMRLGFGTVTTLRRVSGLPAEFRGPRKEITFLVRNRKTFELPSPLPAPSSLTTWNSRRDLLKNLLQKIWKETPVRQTHFFAEYVHGLNSQSSGLGSVMRLFVAPRVLRVPTLRTQSGPLLGSLLPCPGPLCPRPESSQLPPVLGGPQTHPSSQGPSPTHTGPAGDAQPRTGAQRPLVRPSARAPQEWEGVRPRVEGTREGEGLAAGCRDWVRAGKALPFLRADFQDHLGPRGTEEDKKSGGTEVNSLFPGWTFSSAHQIS